MARPRPRPQRGASLIELMIAMAVIAVGLLAMWNLHMVGLTSTAAGRRHTVAVALAQELVSGLERLAFTDPLLAAQYTGPGNASGPPSGAVFGPLVQGDGSIKSGARPWSDSTAVPGVRLDTQMREKSEGVGYDRAWTVWDMLAPGAPVGAAVGTKVIAVSVIWRDPPFARPREVVLYTQVSNPGSIITGMAASP